MTDKKDVLHQAIAAAAAAGDEAPNVEATQIHVRTGMQFLKLNLADDCTGDVAESVRDGRSTGRLLGSFVAEWGYDVDYEHAEKFSRWLLANEPRLLSSAPKDVRYLGTYAVTSTSEKKSGHYRTLWGFDTFEAMQQFGSAFFTSQKQPDEQAREFARLVRELAAFRDRRPTAGESQTNMIPAGGAVRL